MAWTPTRCGFSNLRTEPALTLDAEDQPHLQRAKWLAQTAVLLAPEGDDGLRDLLAEINAISAVWEEERGASSAASMFWNVAFDYVGGGRADVAIPLLQRLNETGFRRYQEGHYAVAAVLLRRAVLLAHRNLGPEHPDVAQSLNNLAWCPRGAGALRRGRDDLSAVAEATGEGPRPRAPGRGHQPQ